MSTTIPPYEISVDQFEQMIQARIIPAGDRVELIRGELKRKMTSGTRHVYCLNRLNRLLLLAVGDQAIISPQNPVRLLDSLPEPDLAVLRPVEDEYATTRPLPTDVLLFVEIADTTLKYDRTVKASLYAENGIREYWIVDLNSEAIDVYRQPHPDGTWGHMRTHGRGEVLTIEALATVSLAAADVLGRPGI